MFSLFLLCSEDGLGELLVCVAGSARSTHAAAPQSVTLGDSMVSENDDDNYDASEDPTVHLLSLADCDMAGT